MRSPTPWLLLLLVAGCATARGVSTGVRAASPEGVVETGQASWYGGQHQGRRTASGEIFDMHDLTAAHRTLPFGARVRVVNLDNGRTVEVRINDRGPHVAGRVIDLSREAARRLGMIGRGVVTVRLTVLAPAEPDASAARPPPED
jgi:rare lipoprotein A